MSSTDPPPRARRPVFDRNEATPRAYERGYGTGIFRRRIMVRLTDSGAATGELEDDFHHFRVDIGHDGTAVTSVQGRGIRSPWTVCLTAGEPLQMLVGAKLATGPSALRSLDAKLNCTHMFDLAGLIVTHAARGEVGDRVYDIAVDDSRSDVDSWPAEGDRRVRLWRDGRPILDWLLAGRTVLDPPEWQDAPLWQGFIDWATTNLDDDLAEAAVALRRACDISHGRVSDLDEMDTAEPLLDLMQGICHAMQPDNAPLAIRHKGSGRDFTDQPELLLADFDSRRQ